MLVVHGDKAYSLDASKNAYSRMKGDNKELLLIPGASHTDLYGDRHLFTLTLFYETRQNVLGSPHAVRGAVSQRFACRSRPHRIPAFFDFSCN